MTQPRIVFNTPTKNHKVALSSTELKGQPYLLVSSTGHFNWVYSDAGTGSHQDLNVYRPAPTDNSMCIVGDTATQGDAVTGVAPTVKAINDDPVSPLLMAPADWTQVWNDQGTGGDYDASIWQPIPPDGYVAIGAVVVQGYDKPSIDNYRCLRQDLVEVAAAGMQIWNDSGSHGHQDVEIYSIAGVANTFLAQGNYSAPVGTYYKIKGH